jgi:transcriptional regulator with GAF, ATPase, and Fis domain
MLARTRTGTKIGPTRHGLSASANRRLLEAADVVVRARNLPDLLKELAPRILNLTGCDFLKFSQHDASQNCMITHYWKRNQESGQCDAFAVDECVSGWVWMHQEVVTISDVEKEKRFPRCMQELRTHGVRWYSVLPLSTSARRFGALGLGKSVPEILDSEDLEFFRRVAFMVSLALENQQACRAGEEQRERLQGLVTIGQQLSSSLELEMLLPIVFANVRQITSCDHTVLALLGEDKKFLRAYAVDHVPGLESLLTDRYRRVLTTEGTAAQAIETRSITLWSAEDLDRAAKSHSSKTG